MLNSLQCGYMSFERTPTPGRATNVSKRLCVKAEHVKFNEASGVFDSLFDRR